MKLIKTSVVTGLLILGVTSCKKDECAECHYDGPNGEIELGQKCNDEIEDLEKNGYAKYGQTYTFHCGEGH
jgi:hypothetical protein